MSHIHRTIPLVTPETPVLIVGAGPTGLVLALELHRRGVPYRIVDRNEGPTPLSKANTIMSRTLEVYDRLGVVDTMLARGSVLPGGVLHRGGEVVGRFVSEGVDSPMPFVLNIPQSELERILRSKLGELGGVIEGGWALCDFEQRPDGVLVELRRADGTRRALRCRYLVGTDGAHSRVRTGLGLPLTGITYPETMLVTDVCAELPRDRYAADAAHVWLHRDGFLLGWPYREPTAWHFVLGLTPQQAAVEAPTIEHVQQWVRERANAPLLRVYDPIWISKFRVHKRSVHTYRVGRVLLLGDAAHLHSPMAGKGLGNSAQEAFNLGWKLAAVVQGTAHDELLDTLEEERLPELRSVMRESELSHRLFSAATPLLRVVRDHVLPRLVSLGPVVRGIVRQNAQLNVHYRRARLSVEHTTKPRRRGWKAGPRAGDRAPDVELVTRDGHATSLFVQLRDPRWSLLAFLDGADPGELQALARVVRRYHTSIRLLTIGEAGELHDPRGVASARYRGDAARLYLVRPDGHIGFRGQDLWPDALARYLEQTLLPDAGASIPRVERACAVVNQ